MKLNSMLLMALAACLSVTAHAQKDATAEVMQANENFMTLFNAGDADKFVTIYTEDARVMPPNGKVITGKENLRDFWQGMMKAGVKPVIKTISAERYKKTIIEEGTVDIYAGDQLADTVKYIVIWKQVDGVWKMHQDIWNSNNPVRHNH